MDDLFDFSSLDFSGGFDLGLNEEGFSNLAEQLTKFAFTQVAGTKSSQPAARQMANLFARQLFATRNAPAVNGGYFGVSNGQSMAKLASIIFRAHRRFL